MTDALWSRLSDLVPEALDLPPAERAAFLDGACTAPDGTIDAALRREAALLVDAADAADATGALDSPIAGLAGAGAVTGALPERVGPWRVTGLLGEGGMGVVYRAERDDGLFTRTVALKQIRPGLGRLFGGRLEAERQVLARLEHDGIARLYDGGVEGGVPYVVMELVEGQPITAYADARKLGTEARVRLFVQVCEAVAYAHRHLVVHRDLKPGNVFVDGRDVKAPTVKLLDFGIAKLLGEDADSALLTQTQAAHTPAYAAPEQLRRGPITTATDVYALGVMLYELLAGRRPYDLSQATAAEAERIVTSVEPPPASAVAPDARARALRGDLDTIVAKALAKEPERRYAAAADLADDLRRHLDGQPVTARPATVGYRVGRFVRRHTLGVAATAAVALALIAGAGVALWQAREARAEAARAATVNAFLVDLFNAPNPEVEGRDVRVASLLDRAAAALDSAGGNPTDEATLRLTLGITYRGLALYDESDAQLRRALALRTRLHGPDHPDVAEVEESLGRMLIERGEYAAADTLLRHALAVHRRHDGERSAQVSEVLNDLGQVRYDEGDYEGAVGYWQEAYTIDEATLPPDDIDLLVGRANLAIALGDAGQLDEATALMERHVAALRRYHPDKEVNLGNALANLGSFYVDAGRYEEAARLQREAVALFRHAVGDRHPDVAFGLNNLGSTLGSLERYDEAEPLLREAVTIYSTAFGEAYEDHPDVGFPLINLARNLQSQRRYDEADPLATRALTVLRTSFGDDHALTARAFATRGLIRLDAGRADDAVPDLREALRIREAALPDDSPDRAVTQSLLGDALRQSGRRDEAAPLLRRSHATLRRLPPPADDRVTDAAARLAALGER